jgi:type IV conjugative transfer system protein TraL
MDNKNIIYKTMDNTPRMLFWEIDDFIVMAAPFFLGVIAGSILVMLSGFVLKKFYTRWKKTYSKGLLRHTIYWHMPTKAVNKLGIFKRLPQSHKRDYLT